MRRKKFLNVISNITLAEENMVKYYNQPINLKKEQQDALLP